MEMIALLCSQTNIDLSIKDVDDLTPIDYSENTEILTLLRGAQSQWLLIIQRLIKTLRDAVNIFKNSVFMQFKQKIDLLGF